MSYPFKFNRTAAIEAVLFLAGKSRDASLHRVFKLLYFAEKHHLENYGRMITGDSYKAMDYGPVPSSTYDLTKMARGDHWKGSQDDDVIDALEIVNDRQIIPKRQPDQLQLSESDLEALNWALREYDHMSVGQLIDLSHDDSWRAAGINHWIDLEALTLDLRDRDLLLEHLQDEHP